MQYLICFYILFNVNVCYGQSSFFKPEHKDTGIMKTDDVKPILDELVHSEMECYMKCLANQDKCCVIEMNEEAGEVKHCLLYNFNLVEVKTSYAKHSKITSVVDNLCKMKSCLEWYQRGFRKDGVYHIEVNGKGGRVFCDMAGGGWTVFQRRFDGSVDFARTWDDYKNGFGNAEGEYWIGNDLIHQITNKKYGVLIKAKTKSFDDESKYVIYDGFKVDSEQNKYKLSIGDYLEGDNYFLQRPDKGFKLNNNAVFTTKDVDNDLDGSNNCATLRGGGGGYWYKVCTDVTQNSRFCTEFGTLSPNNCMRWNKWRGKEGYTYLKFFEMSIK